MSMDPKYALLSFVERKAFDPVLKAELAGLSESDEATLKTLQDKTRTEIERYRDYETAEELVTNFKRDLHSAPAKKVHAELKHLHLPTIEDIRDEFEQKARDLGVGT